MLNLLQISPRHASTEAEFFQIMIKYAINITMAGREVFLFSFPETYASLTITMV